MKSSSQLRVRFDGYKIDVCANQEKWGGRIVGRVGLIVVGFPQGSKMVYRQARRDSSSHM